MSRRLCILSKCSMLAGFFRLLWHGKGSIVLFCQLRWVPDFPLGLLWHREVLSSLLAGRETQAPASLSPRALSGSGGRNALATVPLHSALNTEEWAPSSPCDDGRSPGSSGLLTLSWWATGVPLAQQRRKFRHLLLIVKLAGLEVGPEDVSVLAQRSSYCLKPLILLGFPFGVLLLKRAVFA